MIHPFNIYVCKLNLSGVLLILDSMVSGKGKHYHGQFHSTSAKWLAKVRLGMRL